MIDTSDIIGASVTLMTRRTNYPLENFDHMQATVKRLKGRYHTGEIVCSVVVEVDEKRKKHLSNVLLVDDLDAEIPATFDHVGCVR